MKQILQKTLFLALLLLTFQSMQAQLDATIAEIREGDADGLSLLEGDTVKTSGIAIGPNFRPGGLTFVLYDLTDNIGMTIFSNGDNLGYGVTDGDELEIIGQVSSFNGLTEVIPTSITILSQGTAIPDPVTVTTLDETTEGSLVRFENATLVNSGNWDNSGSSFNIEITNGTDVIEIRVDSDTEIAGSDAPTEAFHITGIGGQYDDAAPYDEGYQLFPRNLNDIEIVPNNVTNIYEGKIELFPNPTTEFFEVQADDLIENISVIDLNGKVVLNSKNSNRTDVSDLSNGYYIINVELENGVWSSVLMIN